MATLRFTKRSLRNRGTALRLKNPTTTRRIMQKNVINITLDKFPQCGAGHARPTPHSDSGDSGVHHWSETDTVTGAHGVGHGVAAVV